MQRSVTRYCLHAVTVSSNWPTWWPADELVEKGLSSYRWSSVSSPKIQSKCNGSGRRPLFRMTCETGYCLIQSVLYSAQRRQCAIGLNGAWACETADSCFFQMLGRYSFFFLSFVVRSAPINDPYNIDRRQQRKDHMLIIFPVF